MILTLRVGHTISGLMSYLLRGSSLRSLHTHIHVHVGMGLSSGRDLAGCEGVRRAEWVRAGWERDSLHVMSQRGWESIGLMSRCSHE